MENEPECLAHCSLLVACNAAPWTVAHANKYTASSGHPHHRARACEHTHDHVNNPRNTLLAYWIQTFRIPPLPHTMLQLRRVAQQVRIPLTDTLHNTHAYPRTSQRPDVVCASLDYKLVPGRHTGGSRLRRSHTMLSSLEEVRFYPSFSLKLCFLNIE